MQREKERVWAGGCRQKLHPHSHWGSECMLSCSVVWLCVTLWTVAHQSPLSMGFSRQEYWSGLPCPPPEDLPNPGKTRISWEVLGFNVALSKSEHNCTGCQESHFCSGVARMGSTSRWLCCPVDIKMTRFYSVLFLLSRLKWNAVKRNPWVFIVLSHSCSSKIRMH